MGSLPVPRCPLRLGHVHPGLFVPALDGDGGDRRRTVDPPLHPGDGTRRGVDKKIRYQRRVLHAAWSSATARWTVTVERGDTGATEQLTCHFLFGNTGYYRYDAGYTPHFQGTERFTGRIVHPQHWPDDLDCTGKRVVVIGSGATAVTLVPALAAEARHVTMLQRSPSYIVSLPNRNPVDELLRRVLPPRLARFLVRWKNALFTWLIFQVSRHAPKFMTSFLRKGVERQLPEGYDVVTHFTPHYQPWDQRLCFAPDGDLFTAVSEGRASVVTDRIVSFTETGLALASGEELEADVVVTATGLTMQMLGGMTIDVDGRTVDLRSAVAHKSVMLCGVPNLAFTFGYTNASWTLKSDLAARYVCRIVNHMDRYGFSVCTPVAPDRLLPTAPDLDLTAGYVERGSGSFPKQGPRAPWRVRHNYPLDWFMFRHGTLDDELTFSGRSAAKDPAPPLTV